VPTDHRSTSSRSWLLPLLVATGSVSIGVVLGAFVAVQMLATPVKPDLRSQQAALDSKATARSTETTGSASTDDGGVGCGNQTWPYLSRDCVAQSEAKSSETPKPEPEPKNLRVVTPDNVDQSAVAAIEVPPPANATKEPAPPVASPAAAETAAPLPPQSAETHLATAPASTASAPTVTASAPAATSDQPQSPAQARAKPKHERTAKKSKHKLKIEEQAKPDDEDDARVASDEDDDDGRIVRSPRRVGRWRDPQYGVPSDEGRDQRRVVVIRRNEEPFGGGPFGRGGLFGGLFGGFGN
jgi:hypothetical protein